MQPDSHVACASCKHLQMHGISCCMLELCLTAVTAYAEPEQHCSAATAYAESEWHCSAAMCELAPVQATSPGKCLQVTLQHDLRPAWVQLGILPTWFNTQARLTLLACKETIQACKPRWPAHSSSCFMLVMLCCFVAASCESGSREGPTIPTTYGYVHRLKH